MPAFLHKVLVNYANSMIRIRLNNCSIFWKQQEFLHDLNNLQKLVSVGAIHIFRFLQIKTLAEIERPSCYRNGLLLYLSEISFHGVHSKSKHLSIRKQIASSLSSQLILFLQNSHLQRDICRSLILVKLQAFTEAATGDVL